MYQYKKEVKLSYEGAVEKARQELSKEGFGVMTEIDVKATLKKKLDVDFEDYIILGACNPASAHKALQAEKEIGLLLPCNVIVYEGKNGKAVVSAQDPEAALAIVGNPAIAPVAKEARERLVRVIDSLQS